MSGRKIGVFWIGWIVVSICIAPARADSGARPACAGDLFPPYPALDAPPSLKVVEGSGWTPPPCIGWALSKGSTLVLTVGRFRNRSGENGLRRRIGAVSELAGMLYWSAGDQRWEPLIVEAHALSGPADERRRGDFSVDEVTGGRTLYLQQEDNRLGRVTYRLQLRKASAGLVVFTTDNISAARMLGIPVVQPGELETICFLEAERNDVWRYASIGRLSQRAALLAGGRQASLINRAVAWFRYLAGIPLNQEPPAAR